MDEKRLQRLILRELDHVRDVWAFKTITTNRRGVMDIIACVRGRFVGIEVKGSGKLNTLTPAQNIQIERVNSCGGIALAVDNLSEALSVINSVDSLR